MDFPQDISPEEIKMMTLQFMGQHLTGDLKELSRNIISENQTLKGMTIDPVKVINSVPSKNPYATAVNAGINVQHQRPINIQPSAPPPNPVVNIPTESQLILKLDAILEKLNSIEKLLDNKNG